MTQSHLIVTEEGLKIYKDDPASAILCEDQERARQLILKPGAEVTIDAEYDNGGSVTLVAIGTHFCEVRDEGETWQTMLYRITPKIGSIYPVPGIEFMLIYKQVDDCTDECEDDCMCYHDEARARLIEHTAEKEESQEDMLGEILANYREHQYMQKHEESFYDEATFMKAELEKFHLTRKP